MATDVRLVLRQFASTAERLGTNAPIVTDRNLEFTVAYVQDALGFEVQVSRADPFPYVTFFRPSDGDVPGDYTNSRGETVKVSMLSAAERLGVAWSHQARLRALAGRAAAFEEMLTVAIESVELLWPLVLESRQHFFHHPQA